MRIFLRGLVLTCCVVGSARAAVNLELRPEYSPVAVGGVARIQLVAINDSSSPQAIAAIDVVLHWNALALGQISVDNNGPYGWIVSGFLPEPDGINLATDDGDAVHTALASPAPPATIAAHGELLVTTFEFDVLSATPSTPIEIVPSQGQFAQTRVLAPIPEQTNVFGEAAGTSVTSVACASADFDSDGDVDLVDFAAFQRCFTGEGVAAGEVCECLFDFAPDGDVDNADYQEFYLLISGPIP